MPLPCGTDSAVLAGLVAGGELGGEVGDGGSAGVELLALQPQLPLRGLRLQSHDRLLLQQIRDDALGVSV